MEIKKTYKSFDYKCRITKEGYRQGKLEFGEGKPSITVASPPEFKGPPGVISPEDLFVSAITACMMTTYDSFAERAGLSSYGFEAETTGTLEHDGEKYSFTRVEIRARIRVTEESQRRLALELLEKAHKYCLVSASVKSKVNVQGEVVLG